jgi:glycyl-tRNA synthetase (class II)
LEFNNLKDLEKYVNKIAKESMSKGHHVKDTVIDEGKRQVQETVYNVFEPKVYKRTGQLKEQWESEEIADGIAIYPSRRDEDTGKYIPEVIESGIGYDYSFEYNGKERPFVENTRQDLESNKDRVTDALKKDMRAFGLDVE